MDDRVTVWLDDTTGFLTVIGRDGSMSGGVLSDFYLQKYADTNGGAGSWRVDFSTVGGQRVTIDTGYGPKPKTWYQLAVTSDGTNVRFYVNDLSSDAGYIEVGSEALTGTSAAANALAASGSVWTFGRGWWSGALINHVDGQDRRNPFQRQSAQEHPAHSGANAARSPAAVM